MNETSWLLSYVSMYLSDIQNVPEVAVIYIWTSQVQISVQGYATLISVFVASSTPLDKPWNIISK